MPAHTHAHGRGWGRDKRAPIEYSSSPLSPSSSSSSSLRARGGLPPPARKRVLHVVAAARVVVGPRSTRARANCSGVVSAGGRWIKRLAAAAATTLQRQVRVVDDGRGCVHGRFRVLTCPADKNGCRVQITCRHRLTVTAPGGRRRVYVRTAGARSRGNAFFV